MRPGEEKNTFEALVGCGPESARFDSAFFRYLEGCAPADPDSLMIVHSLPEGDFERKTVVLWSGAAAVEFARFWRQWDPGPPTAPVAPEDALSVD